MEEDLADYRLGESGFPAGENYVYGSYVVVIMANAIQKVFQDGPLNHSYLLVLFVCFCLLNVCLLSILSRLCVRQHKIGKKPVWKLKDPNQESSDEKEDRENESKSEFSLLLKYRRIYELIYNISLLFLAAAVILEGLSFYYDQSVKRDFHAAAIALAISGVYILFLIYQVAGSSSLKPLKYSYEPFDEFIRVPMQVFVPKMVLHLASNLLNIVGILIYQFSAIYGLVTISRMPEEQIKRFQDATKLAEIHSVLVTVMTLANLSGVFMIIVNLAAARNSAKEDLLLTFETNWRWNMAAIEFLLPEIEVDSLEELYDAFLEKSQKEDLTAEEQKALRYIERPLWKTRRPFIGNRELNGIPETLRNAKPDAQPSTSKSTEGPQPEEPQPSSSTQRPLRVG